MDYKSPQKTLEERKLRQTQLEESMKASRIRKEKMARLDEMRQKKVPPSTLTLEQ